MPFRYYTGEGRLNYQLVRDKGESGPDQKEKTAGGEVPYYLGGTFLRLQEAVDDLDVFFASTGRIWIIGFTGRNYPGPSPAFQQEFRVRTLGARSFQGVLVALIKVEPEKK